VRRRDTRTDTPLCAMGLLSGLEAQGELLDELYGDGLA
jgi:hypothetical protein